MICMNITLVAMFSLRIASQLKKNAKMNFLQQILQQPKILLQNQVKVVTSY